MSCLFCPSTPRPGMLICNSCLGLDEELPAEVVCAPVAPKPCVLVPAKVVAPPKVRKPRVVKAVKPKAPQWDQRKARKVCETCGKEKSHSQLISGSSPVICKLCKNGPAEHKGHARKVDLSPWKRCKCCSGVKGNSIHFFPARPTGTLRTVCRRCENQRVKAWQLTHPGAVHGYAKKCYAKKCYTKKRANPNSWLYAKDTAISKVCPVCERVLRAH